MRRRSCRNVSGYERKGVGWNDQPVTNRQHRHSGCEYGGFCRLGFSQLGEAGGDSSCVVSMVMER